MGVLLIAATPDTTTTTNTSSSTSSNKDTTADNSIQSIFKEVVEQELEQLKQKKQQQQGEEEYSTDHQSQEYNYHPDIMNEDGENGSSTKLISEEPTTTLTTNNNNNNNNNETSTTTTTTTTSTTTTNSDTLNSESGVEATKDNEEEEELFFKQLEEFYIANGTFISKRPSIKGKKIELFKLYSHVLELGGYTAIKDWNIVANNRELFNHDLFKANDLKKAYRTYLIDFEKTFNNKSEANQTTDLNELVKETIDPQEGTLGNLLKSNLAIDKRKQLLSNPQTPPPLELEERGFDNIYDRYERDLGCGKSITIFQKGIFKQAIENFVSAQNKKRGGGIPQKKTKRSSPQLDEETLDSNVNNQQQQQQQQQHANSSITPIVEEGDDEGLVFEDEYEDQLERDKEKEKEKEKQKQLLLQQQQQKPVYRPLSSRKRNKRKVEDLEGGGTDLFGSGFEQSYDDNSSSSFSSPTSSTVDSTPQLQQSTVSPQPEQQEKEQEQEKDKQQPSILEQVTEQQQEKEQDKQLLSEQDKDQQKDIELPKDNVEMVQEQVIVEEQAIVEERGDVMMGETEKVVQPEVQQPEQKVEELVVVEEKEEMEKEVVKETEIKEVIEPPLVKESQGIEGISNTEKEISMDTSMDEISTTTPLSPPSNNIMSPPSSSTTGTEQKITSPIKRLSRKRNSNPSTPALKEPTPPQNVIETSGGTTTMIIDTLDNGKTKTTTPTSVSTSSVSSSSSATLESPSLIDVLTSTPPLNATTTSEINNNKNNTSNIGDDTINITNIEVGVEHDSVIPLERIATEPSTNDQLTSPPRKRGRQKQPTVELSLRPYVHKYGSIDHPWETADLTGVTQRLSAIIAMEETLNSYLMDMAKEKMILIKAQESFSNNQSTKY